MSFDLHEDELVGGAHFHMNDFTRRLVTTQRQKTTQKLHIENFSICAINKRDAKSGKTHVTKSQLVFFLVSDWLKGSKYYFKGIIQCGIPKPEHSGLLETIG